MYKYTYNICIIIHYDAYYFVHIVDMLLINKSSSILNELLLKKLEFSIFKNILLSVDRIKEHMAGYIMNSELITEQISK